MPCEHFEDALREAAASGAEPQGELREHIRECAACQVAFEQEAALLASIDSGMRAMANAEVPPSLLPRVRARLDEVAAPRSAWSPKWFVLAGAGAMLALVFATQTVWRTRIELQPTDSAVNATHSLPPAKETPGVAIAANPGSVAHRTNLGREKILPRPDISNREAQPEVLVPREQEVLLARFAEDWRQRKSGPMVVKDSEDAVLKPLEVAPIQMEELGVKLLAESESE